MRTLEMPFFTRPSFKLKKGGASSLDDAELLAILLWKGSEKESSLELAHKLLRKYNLNGLEHCGISELAEECSDEIKALKLLSIIELSKRYNKLINKRYIKTINSAEDVHKLLCDEYGNKKKEYFICLYLDTKNNIIKEEVVSMGTLDSSLVHPREVFKSAIKESACSLILAHNHPSGDITPSEQDKEITKRFIEIGNLLGIKVLDHVIISNESYWSYKVNQSNNAP